MCIKIIRDNEEFPYNLNLPLEVQTAGSSEVRINYQPHDAEIESFLQGIERCANHGIDLHLKLKVEYNDFLSGYKAKKKMYKALYDIGLNEIIKLLAISQSEADRKLEEISTICSNRECNGK